MQILSLEVFSSVVIVFPPKTLMDSVLQQKFDQEIDQAMKYKT